VSNSGFAGFDTGNTVKLKLYCVTMGHHENMGPKRREYRKRIQRKKNTEEEKK